MVDISLTAIEHIRRLINEPIIQNNLLTNQKTQWLQLTSSLDAIEDSSSAVNFYVDNVFPNKLGGKYLYTYGLLQALYVVEDCVSSINNSLFGKKLRFSEYPNIDYARNVRDDVQHATDRGQKDKSYIYLTQYNLSKNYFEYYKQAESDFSLQPISVNVLEMIENHNSEINTILNNFIEKLENDIKSFKQKFREKPMRDIFSTLTYANEKMTEQAYQTNARYESVKGMVNQYKHALDERYFSWEECDSDKYEIEFIEKIFVVLDKKLAKIEDIEFRNELKTILVDSLCKHLDTLSEFALEHDSYFNDECNDAENNDELNVHITYEEDRNL